MARFTLLFATRSEIMSPATTGSGGSRGKGYDAALIRQRRQNRDLVRLGATAETGKAACDNFDASFGEPITFFTALQITSREKGFSRKSDIPSFSALNATALGS
jgi:hypothetical protein